MFLKISQNSQKKICSWVFFFKKETLEQVFTCEFCKVFKNTFFKTTPPVVTSVAWQTRLHQSFHIYDLGEVKDGLPIEDFNETCKLTFKEPGLKNFSGFSLLSLEYLVLPILLIG